ncbi:bifunctional metallophosphatase/5'-nucleotidase [Amorphus coralli]|uniref:bifunctional metallophosphatase/5'-nucleotidase n=1 Tax=Amorphus coralli TaxID=340680 RepID=UPI000379C0FD|nr:bifunctional UDP-sugar hydrolase/5'-nucleotidase [Amorphus coralli]
MAGPLSRTLAGLAGLVAAGILALAPLPAGAESGAFTLVVVNDVDQMTSDTGKGGLDRIATVVREERARGGDVVVVHAGDALSPSILSSMDRGAHMVDLLNQVGIDIFVPGNHEFDFGRDIFLERMAALETTKLAANLRDAQNEKLAGFNDRIIREIAGLKVGFLGIAGDRTPVVSSPGDLRFAPSIQTAFDQARLLRNEGADFIVAVVHDNISRDLLLARSGAFDVVLSGDDHVLTVTYDGRSALLESREQGELLVVMDVDFSVEESNGRRDVDWHPAFRIVETATVAPDPNLSASVSAYQASLDEGLDDPICTIAAELDTRRASVRMQEAAFGNLIADAMREATGADIAITNGGSIRGDRVYPAGTPMTLRNLLTELPFANRTVLVEITGTDIVRALENGFSLSDTGAGRFPQVSGMIVEADRSRPAGSRIAAVTIAGEPLDPGRRYRLATNDFLARGGDGYSALRNADTIIDAKDGVLVVNVVAAHLGRAAAFTPKTDGRIRLD